MKLTKEEIQKIFLGALMLIGVIYGYKAFLLEPLQRKEAALRKQIDALTPQIAAARATIETMKATERSAPMAHATVDQIARMIPEGSPLAWFPTRIGDLFKSEGIEKASTRPTRDPDDKLPGEFRFLAWTVELPKIDLISFGVSLARLENEEPLLEVHGLQIEASEEDTENQNPRAVLSLYNIVNK